MGTLGAGRSVLIVDDDAGVAMVLAGLIRQGGFDAHVESSADGALAHVDRENVDIVLTDLRMPGKDGMTLLRELGERAPGVPVVMLTAHGNVETAVAAMRAGAADFLTKPFVREEVLFSLDKALRAANADADAPPDLAAGKMVTGRSTAMQEVTAVIARASSSTAHVLIRGESGTGKEVAARTIHESGPRKDAPFVAVNCAALPDNLLESELFGYEKGAFTGASQRKPGRVSLAEGGTLMLDEIGDVSPAVQVKLLRLLQEREYEPLGATAPKKANVRFIAATHQDLEAMVEDGSFREDLYYRLNVVPIWMPPLRDRTEDVAPLAERFCAELAQANGRDALTLDASAVRALESHDFPGNVRELQNLIERAVVFCDGPHITAADIAREIARSPRPRTRAQSTPSTPAPTSEPSSAPADSRDAPLAERKNQAEREAIAEALDRSRGNRTQAARLLGISRRTLYKRMNALAMSS